MKQLLLFACLLLTTTGLMAQKVVYVNGAATGADNGDTWADAYTELDSALLNAPVGASIWIAAGTYTTPAERSFVAIREMEILGGFAGTESDATAADPATNVTILSGDVMGNDVAGTYDSLAYLDNNRILAVIDTSGGTYTTKIDGITFSNGGIAADGGNLDFAGAGLYLRGRADVSRCVFMNNRSTFGSALTIFGAETSGTTLDNITFMNNFAQSSFNAYIERLDDLTITNSTFIGLGKTSDNQDEMLRISDVNGVVVDNCTFSNINGRAVRGAGINFVGTDNVMLMNSTFDQIASTRGGVYVSGAPGRPDADPTNDMVVTNCTFSNITSSDRSALGGGGNQNWIVNSTNFTNNDVDLGSSGTAGFYTFGVNATPLRHSVTLNDCSFDGHVGGRFGGAVTILEFDSASIDLTLNNTTLNNSTLSSTEAGFGGTIYVQGDANDAANALTLNDVTISGGVSRYGSGIMFNSPYELNATNTTFANNGTSTDASQGAAITFYYDPGTVGANFDGCTFRENVIGENPVNVVSGGGALYGFGPDAGTVPFSIKNSIFQRNSAGTAASGAALHFRSGFDVTIEDCDFLENSSTGDGGAINAVRGLVSRDTLETGIDVVYGDLAVDVKNSTFIGNSSGSQGGAISTQRLVVGLENSIFLRNLVTDGSGGAFIFNGNAPSYNTNEGKWDSIGSVVLEANIVHNTFFENRKGEGETAVGNQIALFQGGENVLNEVNSMTLNFLNNAFMSEEATAEGINQIEVELYNPDGNFGPGDLDRIGAININSLGGNFFNGENGANIEFGDTDRVVDDAEDEDALLSIFLDPFNDEDDLFDLDLVIGDDLGVSNPLIDGGVANALVPERDIFGTLRGRTPDIGAIEAEWELTGVTSIDESGLDMAFFPNPTVDVVTIQNNDADISKFYVTVSSLSGQVISANVFNGVNSRIDLSEVPAGVYNLTILANGALYSKQIVKQ
ncbi:T9SS type A sorting domain-containing protein [Lewinella sp. 4G2]|uniref:T9SS type A sorting domain-containing protein n=1 Tax=Lewinella sp. 4G2 TaxID=1803372 RepID=UPI0007B4B5CC|nr:T9SS type A sorting domain-containing protein [Lewinella sp. 4G2]OAV43018.1 hypothetical protein A3850_000210 [Lewinella sp. 4G2]